MTAFIQVSTTQILEPMRIRSRRNFSKGDSRLVCRSLGLSHQLLVERQTWTCKRVVMPDQGSVEGLSSDRVGNKQSASLRCSRSARLCHRSGQSRVS